MSEYNPVVINWASGAKRAGLSFLIVNLGVPWTLLINQCSRGIVLNVCCSSSLEGNCHTTSTSRPLLFCQLLEDCILSRLGMGRQETCSYSTVLNLVNALSIMHIVQRFPTGGSWTPGGPKQDFQGSELRFSKDESLCVLRSTFKTWELWKRAGALTQKNIVQPNYSS